MHLIEPFERIRQYGKRHGLRATIGRLWVSFKRGWRGQTMVLFYCDLGEGGFAPPDWPEGAKVEQKGCQSELDAGDFQQILSAWNPQIARRRFVERFALGASLWLLKIEQKIAAYGWSIIGDTVEPYFFPLGNNDVHLFDFFVFPDYRGRRINCLLVAHVLSSLGAEINGRAFIEAARWNEPQLSSLKRTPFQKLGHARKIRAFGYTIVLWGRETFKH